MEFIGNNEVQAWMCEVGIAFDDRKGPAIHLGELSTFWPRPEHQESWPHFASSLLMGLDPWDEIVVWPRAGNWLLPPNNIDWGVVMPGGPGSEEWVGGLRFSRGEIRVVIAVMFVHLSLGWCAPHDLFLVPDHGQQHLEVNHDDEVYVSFRDESRADAFVQYMTTRGFLTPFEELERDERGEQVIAPCGGVVANGVIRALDPDVLLPQHSRVTIIGA